MYPAELYASQYIEAGIEIEVAEVNVSALALFALEILVEEGEARPRTDVRRSGYRVQMSLCEVVEMKNSADAVGYSCPGAASKECSECGIQLCEDHAETCGICHSRFCPSCLSFHSAQHPKAASAYREQNRERKSA